jgi:DNA processing protein
MDHLIPWLTLKSVPGIGNLHFRCLMEHFGSPQAVLAASEAALRKAPSLTPRLAEAIVRHTTPPWVHIELERVCERGYSLITQQDPGYPSLLLEIPDPPPILYINGQIDPHAASIAVVGSRNASSYGLTTTHGLCKGLAARGIVVVSGMARGIDTAAHRGALEAQGQTVAVLGSGLECIYPAQNRTLYHQIAANGAVISEFRLDAQPEPRRFPMRNRIISGISLGTVVVEAAQRSGSLITARLAAEQGREVFAVPGNIHAATTHGTHLLIQQGAKLVCGVDDILAEIAPRLERRPAIEPQALPAKPLPRMTATEATVFDALGAYEVHIDSLADQLAIGMAALSGILVQLELQGLACRRPGNHYVRHNDYLNMGES